MTRTVERLDPFVDGQRSPSADRRDELSLVTRGGTGSLQRMAIATDAVFCPTM